MRLHVALPGGGSDTPVNGPVRITFIGTGQSAVEVKADEGPNGLEVEIHGRGNVAVWVESDLVLGEEG
jgi:hypothetical protein